MCTACQYWQTDAKTMVNKRKAGSELASHSSRQICVSQPIIESSNTGFYAQMKGWLTTKRYRAAMIFVNQYSSFTYVHLQTSTTDRDKTLKAKGASKVLSCSSYGVCYTLVLLKLWLSRLRLSISCFSGFQRSLQRESISTVTDVAIKTGLVSGDSHNTPSCSEPSSCC
jgi:hypothetical protein